MSAQNFISKLNDHARLTKKIIFFDSVFNVLILFLVFAVIFSLIESIEFKYLAIISIILSIIISFILFLKKIKSYDILKKISRKYPDYEECLNTAYDNKEKDNVIIRGLMRDAASEMREVDAAVFFNKKQITLKVFLIIFLSFLLLSFTFVTESMAINNLLNEGSTGNHTNDRLTDEEKQEEWEEKRDIFKNKTELQPEGEPVPLEIKGYHSAGVGDGELEYEGVEGSDDEIHETLGIPGEKKEYKEDEIIRDDTMLGEAIKEKYNRTK